MTAESRRVHGRHPLLPRGGAAVDAELGAGAEAAAERWLERARSLLEPRGLGPVRAWVSEGRVALAAECAPWHRLQAALLLDVATGARDRAEVVVEPEPALAGVLARVAASGRVWFADGRGLTVGLGRRALTWSWDALRAAPARALEDLSEPRRHCPLVLVAGEAPGAALAERVHAVAWADGWLPALAISAGLWIGQEPAEELDASGLEGARRALRHERPNFAVLQCSLSALWRRGLLPENADVAVLTPTGPADPGAPGPTSGVDRARVAAVLADGVRRGGVVVIPAGEPALEAAVAERVRLRPDLVVRRWSLLGPADAWVEEGALRLHGRRLLRAEELPPASEPGAALAAALAAEAAGVGDDAIAEGLRSPPPDRAAPASV